MSDANQKTFTTNRVQEYDASIDRLRGRGVLRHFFHTHRDTQQQQKNQLQQGLIKRPQSSLIQEYETFIQQVKPPIPVLKVSQQTVKVYHPVVQTKRNRTMTVLHAPLKTRSAPKFGIELEPLKAPAPMDTLDDDKHRQRTLSDSAVISRPQRSAPPNHRQQLNLPDYANPPRLPKAVLGAIKHTVSPKVETPENIDIENSLATRASDKTAHVEHKIVDKAEIAKEPELEHDVKYPAKANDNRIVCSNCHRRFATDRIEVHEQICKAKKKRQTFDSSKMRTKGTQMEIKKK
ncbi:hypothetical protein ROZALSC1DRAFT_26663 [Rozella allomycis CSF55]|uniref:C2HC/C3H-type domain-containing protein n=1 Tax=Rozella allomycis (strain CSF55) TaxID=988480 RepID=A0A075AQ48_ROZAC|nr:hypothetical protein O9G_003409 [Rozella allomycis CSF55]RKP21949.1 hypothetical protein ROZALSC1DRAFT_26663 [Rozella allomycis CSF55]|eukprot:EPZ32265.1 hypothetical protein O9G_003409 [Rozella allomycis CSF55]